jgi:very-short-patch-repair endonuclease
MRNHWGRGSRRHDDVPEHLKEYAQENRENPTEAEQLLWERLCRSQLGVEFWRQHSEAGYIVDFYCKEVRLAVEVDGGYHKRSAQQRDYDEKREQALKRCGLRILRFTNEEVFESLDSVVWRIKGSLRRGRFPR